MVCDGATPLILSSCRGNFRCVVELLRGGSNREHSIFPLGSCCPQFRSAVESVLTQGNDARLIEWRQTYASASYVDIMGLLARGYSPCTPADEQLLERMKPVLPAMLQHICNVKSKSGKKGFARWENKVLWDGYCYRFLVNGDCDCSGQQCPGCAEVASSVGIRYDPVSDGVMIVGDAGMKHPDIVNFLMHEYPRFQYAWNKKVCFFEPSAPTSSAVGNYKFECSCEERCKDAMTPKELKRAFQRIQRTVETDL